MNRFTAGSPRRRVEANNDLNTGEPRFSLVHGTARFAREVNLRIHERAVVRINKNGVSFEVSDCVSKSHSRLPQPCCEIKHVLTVLLYPCCSALPAHADTRNPAPQCVEADFACERFEKRHHEQRKLPAGLEPLGDEISTTPSWGALARLAHPLTHRLWRNFRSPHEHRAATAQSLAAFESACGGSIPPGATSAIRASTARSRSPSAIPLPVRDRGPPGPPVSCDGTAGNARRVPPRVSPRNPPPRRGRPGEPTVPGVLDAVAAAVTQPVPAIGLPSTHGTPSVRLRSGQPRAAGMVRAGSTRIGHLTVRR
jgi:hypothetical protein